MIEQDLTVIITHQSIFDDRFICTKKDRYFSYLSWSSTPRHIQAEINRLEDYDGDDQQ